MVKPIYITGHRNPDTDSICATIAYADLKTKQGQEVTPIRIGNLNSETTFILNKFNVIPPTLVRDLKTKVSDIKIDVPLTVSPDTTISEAWRLMIDNNRKVIAVVDTDQTLIGIATVSGITNAILSAAQSKYDLIQKTNIEDIADTLLGRMYVKPQNYYTNGIINIGTSTLINKDFIAYKDKIVITSSREEAMLKAIETDAALVIATLTKSVSENVINKAIEHECGLICTTLDLFTASQTITQAIQIRHIMSTDLITFNHSDYLDDVKAIIPKSRFRSYPVLNQQKQLVGLLSRYHLWDHEKRQLILVDHNERSQSVDGIEQVEVIEIIDHHRIGNIETSSPALFRNETLGSTCTIISKMYKENNIKIEPTIAALLLGAIISDTMHFKSPTCTRTDIEIATELAEIANLCIEDYAAEIFKASASLAGKTISEIVHSDLKTFNIESYKIAIGQINIIDAHSIMKIKDQIDEYLENLSTNQDYSLCIMIFTDVYSEGSYLLYQGTEEHLFIEAFQDLFEEKDGLTYLPNTMSRKKQIVPAIAKAISNYGH